MAGINAVRAKPAPKKSPDAVTLPSGMDIQVRYNTKTRYFIERAPRQQLIHFSNCSYTLWMPWTYYVLAPMKSDLAQHWFEIKKIMVSLTKAKDDSPLYRLPLPNIYEAERPCYSIYSADQSDDLITALVSPIMLWDAEVFNYDNLERARKNPVYQYLAKRAKQDSEHYSSFPHVLKEWEKLTLEEVKLLPWHECTTVRKVTHSTAVKVLRKGVKYQK